MLIKDKKQPIVCEWGKTITKPYWYKKHLTTAYHNNHAKVIIKWKSDVGANFVVKNIPK